MIANPSCSFVLFQGWEEDGVCREGEAVGPVRVNGVKLPHFLEICAETSPGGTVKKRPFLTGAHPQKSPFAGSP